MDKKTKKIVALSLGGLVILGGGAYIGSQVFPKTINTVPTIEDTAKVTALQTQVADLQAHPVVQTITVDHNVTVEKIVTVDNGNLDLVEKFLYDNNGDVHFITNDLKEKELPLIVDRILFTNDIKTMAISEVQDKAFDKLDDKTVGAVTLNMRKMSELRIKDDFSDINLTQVDYKYKDADALVKATFTYDDTDKYDVTFRVSFVKDTFDAISVDSIVKE